MANANNTNDIEKQGWLLKLLSKELASSTGALSTGAGTGNWFPKL